MDAPFRIALALVMLATMTVTVRWRLKAAAAGENISHRNEGYLFAAVLRLVGVVLWIATFVWLIAPQWLQWCSFPLPAAVRWGGVALGLFCAPLMAWTLESLGHNLTDTVVTRAQATLVTHGPYRYVRHPFYVTAALLMLSATMISANALIGLSGAAVMALLAVRTPREEQFLADRFGDDYSRYQQTTGRFLPRLFRRQP